MTDKKNQYVHRSTQNLKYKVGYYDIDVNDYV